MGTFFDQLCRLPAATQAQAWVVVLVPYLVEANADGHCYALGEVGYPGLSSPLPDDPHGRHILAQHLIQTGKTELRFLLILAFIVSAVQRSIGRHQIYKSLCVTCAVPERLVPLQQIKVGLFADSHSKPLALDGQHLHLPGERPALQPIHL